MSSGLLAAVLREHQIRIDPNHPAYGYCHCGFNPDSDSCLTANEYQAEHVAELIHELSGVAVVELPEGDPYPLHEERAWEVGDSTVFFSEKWLNIRAELDYDHGDDDPLSVDDARAFAAALLAAVKLAKAAAEAAS